MAAESSVNSETVEQTKQQIRSLVAEISQIAKSDIGAEEFYAAFLQRIVSALAAVGGAIWLVGEGRRLQLAYQIKLSDTLLDSASEEANRHFRLLNHTLQTNEGSLVPPQSGAIEEDGPGNPTNFLLVLCPMGGDGQAEGLVEIFQRPNSPPATQRGYLRFLEQMCELAGEWLKTQKLRQISDRQSLWAEADQFSRMIHESLDLRETAYAVVNEGRRLIGCDRVSVAMKKGRKCHIEAISGQDTLENRSNIVHALGKLATKVVATGEPLWYEGSTEDLPPQIEQAIDDYVEESFAKGVTVLPLRRPQTAAQVAERDASGQAERDSAQLGEVIGALIVEQIESDVPRQIFAPRMDLVYQHSARAITNSMDHTNLFLMPVWRTLGRASWIVRARTLPKTLTIAGLIIAALAILTFVKKDFYLKSAGALQPSVKRDVFVAEPGIIHEIHVKDQQEVKAGDPLVTLKSTDLEVQIKDVLGQITATNEQLASARRTLLGGTQPTRSDRQRIGGQQKEYLARLESYQKQYELLQLKRDSLVVRAPIDGRVMLAWDVEESLRNRTVQPGQVLMSVADPTSEWELELYMKETRMGHVDLARHNLTDGVSLPVEYVLMTEPGKTLEGTVAHIQHITQMHDEEGHTVRIRVDIDEQDVFDPRPGAAVRGKVLCGSRSIGYTWFHEAIEWVQAHLLF